MRVTTDDGRELRIGRRWLPWRPRPREFDGPVDFVDVVDGTDLAGVVLSVVLAIVLSLLAPLLLVVLVLTGEVLLVLLLAPLAVAVRVLLRRPWLVEVREGGTLLHAEKVAGWRASRDRILAFSTAPSLVL